MERTDLTVFGATGFTGKLVCEHLAKKKEGMNGLKWAISGRSLEKLLDLKKDLLKINSGLDIDVVVAAIDKPETIEAMTALTRVVLNCVGPFNTWGEIVIKACIKSRTHYMDVSGEPQFSERIAKKYHSEAEVARIWIINSCSFSSIPCDIGCLYATSGSYQNYKSVETYMKMSSSGDWIDRASFNMSGGTWHATLDLLKQPIYLLDNNPNISIFTRIINSLPGFSRLLKTWTMPLPSTDQFVVLRTIQLMKIAHNVNNFQLFYRNHIVLRSFFHLLSLSGIFALFGLLVHLPILRNYAYSRKVEGTGPSSELRKKDGVILEVVATTKEGKVQRSRLTLPEIYNFTAIALGEAGVLMVDKLDAGTVGLDSENSSPSIRGGVVTPAFALGVELCDRLRDFVQFERL